MGWVAARRGHYDEARRPLEHYIAVEANSCASYYELALLYEKKGMTDLAMESWQRFIPLTQDQPLKAEAHKPIASRS